jgi:hypothetical protein
MSHPIVPRRAERRPVMMPTLCRTQSGLRDNARISDISPQGCCLATHSLAFSPGMRVVIRPQGLEGITGTVRWTEGYSAGVEFDAPLYEPVVDHLSQLHAANKPVTVSY